MRTPPPLRFDPLDPAAQDAVRALAAAAAAHDDVPPLSEQPLLRLGTDADWLTHVAAHDDDGTLVGYLQVDRGGEEASAELVVHPQHRRRGVGGVLLRTAERDARLPMFSGAPGQRGKPLRVWAHGDLPAARSFAAAHGYEVARELLVLARPLGAGDAAAEAPETPGLRLRTFRPGEDDEAWVRLNARTFADHPEQGRLTTGDLRDRQREPWFDAEGFFLVEPDGGGEPLGYLWTKVEPGQDGGARDDGGRTGEIYAVGVSPDAQGRGLGRSLAAVGLRHLARVGCDRAVLYVDGDNAAALATYASAGFERAAVDVQYARPAAAA
ncbi:mycothiol synthase [Krasilnikoviella flava]|uniref:Mycothiol acetyltransferase n=1 Tax=Krasilnikoviella flava TaxID=526729 RepID=A0A1T5LIP0_9MICO|nr:mycothiol synthase [Krasilnikoviella flava]SKC75278.1 mycothiol synthase [Krasilnikoviella flava]